MRDELLDLGFPAGRHRIARLMRELGLKGCPKKRYRVTTQSNHRFRIAPNRLARDFTAEAPNQRWVADITYIRTQEGWLYLAAVMDLYSMAIVGWSMSERLNREVVVKALMMAIWQRKPDAQLLHHSDRGSQYASADFQDLLAEHGIECSMSGAGSCYDNAAMEGWFGMLKRERVNRRNYRTRTEARQDVFDYIERFYNRRRPHGSAGRMIPEDDEYECPAGDRLIYRFTGNESGKQIRRYWSSACISCPIRSWCTPSDYRRISRWEHERVIERAEARIKQHPEMMRVRRATVEHPFGTLKAWMGSTHFLTKTLKKTGTEMSLHVLAYNMKRVISLVGVQKVIEAI